MSMPQDPQMAMQQQLMQQAMMIPQQMVAQHHMTPHHPHLPPSSLPLVSGHHQGNNGGPQQQVSTTPHGNHQPGNNGVGGGGQQAGTPQVHHFPPHTGGLPPGAHLGGVNTTQGGTVFTHAGGMPMALHQQQGVNGGQVPGSPQILVTYPFGAPHAMQSGAQIGYATQGGGGGQAVSGVHGQGMSHPPPSQQQQQGGHNMLIHPGGHLVTQHMMQVILVPTSHYLRYTPIYVNDTARRYLVMILIVWISQ